MEEEFWGLLERASSLCLHLSVRVPAPSLKFLFPQRSLPATLHPCFLPGFCSYGKPGHGIVVRGKRQRPECGQSLQAFTQRWGARGGGGRGWVVHKIPQARSQKSQGSIVPWVTTTSQEWAHPWASPVWLQSPQRPVLLNPRSPSLGLAVSRGPGVVRVTS